MTEPQEIQGDPVVWRHLPVLPETGYQFIVSVGPAAPVQAYSHFNLLGENYEIIVDGGQGEEDASTRLAAVASPNEDGSYTNVAIVGIEDDEDLDDPKVIMAIASELVVIFTEHCTCPACTLRNMLEQMIETERDLDDGLTTIPEGEVDPMAADSEPT